MTTIYGIKNCDTVKKARKWLDQNGIEAHFHDFRDDGLTKEQVEMWTKQVGWEVLLNKRSTTWKQLDSTVREQIDQNSAIAAILEHPTLIKRPVLEAQGELLVGFKAEQYSSLFG
ncbi:ArsC family reductase [Porticoccaceae bacterium LTM1]|nr:ArsC family reductase [Porticoccaceae bacterium LTM1]